MYIVTTRVDNRSSWRAMPRIYKDREKAAIAADDLRDHTRGEQARVVWIGEPDDWPKD